MPKHYAPSDNDSARIDDYYIPDEYKHFPLDEAYRAYADDLIHNADSVVDSFTEKLHSEKLAVGILKGLGIGIVAGGVLVGAIFSIHHVLQTLNAVTQLNANLILWFIIEIIGYCAVAALVGLGFAELMNYLFGDPYHNGRRQIEDYEAILEQLQIEQQKEHYRAEQYRAAADELERRVRQLEKVQQDTKALDDHSDEPPFLLFQGGRR